MGSSSEDSPDDDSPDGTAAAGTAADDTAAARHDARTGRMQCPFCHSYDVARLFVASLGLDSCECAACGARWDEERHTGRYRGRSDRESILMRGQG